uniref:Leucine rich repeat containing 56 n=1 Tax=Salvator merianae TaxID=96440 RepID=A0A8D0C8R3_SALMN
MEVNWKLGRISRPGSATVRVTDLGWQGLLNPSPLTKEDDEDLLVDEYLSPSKLKRLTGLDDLRQVKVLEIRVDTRENSLGNFGAYLPNLKQLKLNNSVLTSVRDLGTGLSHLQVLWMARCRLPDLDGISSCRSLKELYIAYNNIADLSQVSLLEHLEILDLEGNNVEDLGQIQYLGLCPKLSSLTVEGNLICFKPSPQTPEDPDYNYRAEVKKRIPHLKYLDEISADQTDLPFPCKMNKDWLLVKESIKDGSLIEELSDSDSHSRPVARWPCSATRLPSALFLSACRPQTPQRRSNGRWLPGTGPLLEATLCDEMLLEDDASDLTHGVSKVICGNPIKALHARRQKLSSSVMKRALCHPAEDTDDFGETGYVSGEDLLAELKDLKGRHYQHLQSFQKEKTKQVLKVTPGDSEVRDNTLSDSGDEDLKGVIPEEVVESPRPESSPQPYLSWSSSGADSLPLEETSLGTVIKCSFLPSPPKCPSPASTQRVTAGLLGARRLKVPNVDKANPFKKQFPSTMSSTVVEHLVEKTADSTPCGKPDASLSDVSVPRQRHRTFSTGSKQTKSPSSGSANSSFGSSSTRIDEPNRTKLCEAEGRVMTAVQDRVDHDLKPLTSVNLNMSTSMLEGLNLRVPY